VKSVPAVVKRDHAEELKELEATVKDMWHPLGRSSGEILAWRNWLERKNIRQPFKQAHREAYVLSNAERRTGDYSTRLAGHILRQHQFHALAAVQGWRNKLPLDADDSVPPPTRDLPQWGLRAEYWVEGDRDDWGADTTESGSYLRLRTAPTRCGGTHSTHRKTVPTAAFVAASVATRAGRPRHYRYRTCPNWY
jgi:hypothetical protein